MMGLEQEVWQFPGGPSGSLPDQETALAHVKELGARGASFFIVPGGDLPWLEAYPGFVEELGKRWPLVARQKHLCTVFDLTDPIEDGNEQA